MKIICSAEVCWNKYKKTRSFTSGLYKLSFRFQLSLFSLFAFIGSFYFSSIYQVKHNRYYYQCKEGGKHQSEDHSPCQRPPEDHVVPSNKYFWVVIYK